MIFNSQAKMRIQNSANAILSIIIQQNYQLNNQILFVFGFLSV